MPELIRKVAEIVREVESKLGIEHSEEDSRTISGVTGINKGKWFIPKGVAG
jgi:hypothetical protein